MALQLLGVKAALIIWQSALAGHLMPVTSSHCWRLALQSSPRYFIPSLSWLRLHCLLYRELVGKSLKTAYTALLYCGA